MRCKTTFAPLLIALAISTIAAGCADRTVLVPPGQPVLIVRPVKAHVAHVSGKNADGWPTWSGDSIQEVPAGYVAQPLPASPQKK